MSCHLTPVKMAVLKKTRDNKHERTDIFFDILLSFLSNIYPEVKLLDHRTVVFSIFWRTFPSFAIVATPIYILHILTTLIISCLFVIPILNCIKWYLAVIWFAFPWGLGVLSIFAGNSGLLIYLRKMSILILCLFLIKILILCY